MDDQLFEIEKQNLRDNIYYGNFKVLKQTIVKIDHILYNKAKTYIIDLPSHSKDKDVLEQIKKSKAQISKLRKDIKKGHILPPIALNQKNNIIDGNHRIMALYKEQKKQHYALIVEV